MDGSSLSQSIIGLFLLCFPLGLSGQQLFRINQAHQQMGTQWKIVLYHQDTVAGHQIMESAFKRLDQLNSIFSDYDLASELSQLSSKAESKEWIRVSEDLFDILVLAKKYAKKSKGAFDPTVGPLSKLWRRAFRRQVFPDWPKIVAAQTNVNYRKLGIKRPHFIRLKSDKMQLDLGGIAKGWAVDDLARLLVAQGVTSFLIDGGGDIKVGEAPPHQTGWTIRLPDSSYQVLENQAIATSGAQYRFLIDDGKKYSHIINPTTGIGIDGTETVTVIAKSCVVADVSATIISILKANSRPSFIRKERNIHQLIIQKYEEKKFYQK